MSDPRKAPGPGPEARCWTKVVIQSPPAKGEEIAVFLAELTGGGVEHVARDEGMEHVVGYLGDPSLFPSQKRELETYLAGLDEDGSGTAPKIVGSEPVPDEDWQRSWRSHFQTVRATPRVVIRPPWEEYHPRRGERVIEIDPGMAFGTGLHASTRLTLSFIDDLYPGAGADLPLPAKVLDVGTGTGILSMACVLLGAKRVLAIDNDPQAVSAARENIARNGLGERITVSGQGLETVEGSFGLIAANILFDTLSALSPDLTERLDPGGSLLCAGILAGEQQERLREIFEKRGLTCVEERVEGDWAALRFDRETGPSGS